MAAALHLGFRCSGPSVAHRRDAGSPGPASASTGCPPWGKRLPRRWSSSLAVSAEEGNNGGERERSRGPLSAAMGKIADQLGNYGVGREQAREGGVSMLFLGAGLGLLAVFSWASAAGFFKKTKGYSCVLEFPKACGIGVGTPVRIRGVQIGQVLAIRPSLERVDAVVEIQDEKEVIPRNAKIEANQSGLIMDPLIDVTPLLPLPTFRYGPNDTRCPAEGAIVCNRERAKGDPGVSLDDLVYVGTKIARQIDMDGFDKMLDTAEIAQQAIRDAEPLLKYAAQLAEELVPMVEELKDGTLMKSIESLSSTAAAAAKDLHALTADVMTKENVDALKDSVRTLTETLKHVESISGNLSKMSGDRSIQNNLKQLIEALSKLLAD